MIDLLGTIHTSRKSKKKISELINRNSYEIILYEGAKDKIHKKYWKKDPIICLILCIYFWALRKKGSEFAYLEKLSQNSNVKAINIDYTINKCLEIFCNFNNLVIIVLFILVIFTSKSIPFPIKILGFLLTLLGYLLYFVLSVDSKRNENFLTQINKYKKKSNILVIVGKSHIQFLKEKISDAKII